MLATRYTQDDMVLEIGVDEVGRGPLFGRVYAAAVILPPPGADFPFAELKDSKRFHSKKKIAAIAKAIETGAVAWHVAWRDEACIDRINILQAAQEAMRECILALKPRPNTHRVLVDGDYFKPIMMGGGVVPHVCIPGGDNLFCAIAAASILAKVARDAYIGDLCAANPELADRYSINTNMGYGAKRHIDGLREHGLSPWHRRSFGICKTLVRCQEQGIEQP